MVKQKRTQIIEAALEGLRTDLITKKNTRPQGENDTNPPHEVILGAITRAVTKELRAIKEEDLQGNAPNTIQKWNHYIAFAFAPKACLADYHAHQKDIEAIADIAQTGALKGQLDRQLAWRARALPQIVSAPNSSKQIDNPLAEVYRDLVIRHNTKYILGSIGNILKKINTNLVADTNDYTARVIESIKKKLVEEYDPVRVTFSTYMGHPIRWAVLRELKGLAQDRFDRNMKVGFSGSSNNDGESMTYEPEDRAPRNAANDGLVFADEHNGSRIITRLKRAARQLDSEQTREIFALKLATPFATLKEIGEEVGVTRERVRQIFAEIGTQIRRIDPALSEYCDAIIHHDEDGLDREILDKRQGPSLRQLQVRSLLHEVREDMEQLKELIGTRYINERPNGGIIVSKAALRGNTEKQLYAMQLTETAEAVKILRLISESAYKDADFDVLSLRQLQTLAFYPNGSDSLSQFIDDHIEDIAKAARDKHLSGSATAIEKMHTRSDHVITEYLNADDKALGKLNRMKLKNLFTAITDSDEHPLNAGDLKLIRRLAIQNTLKRDFGVA